METIMLGFAKPHATKVQAQPASDEVNVSRGGTLAGPGRAVHGYDVVAYFNSGVATPGSDKFAVAYRGATYRFASQANLETFLADSERFTPAFGGFCAFGVKLGKKLDGDPQVWKIVNDRLYLNLNSDIAVEWVKDVPGNIATAETNWAKIRATAIDLL
jgi:YHS domain-containing protein